MFKSIIQLVAGFIDGMLLKYAPAVEAYVKEAAVLSMDIVESVAGTDAEAPAKKAAAVAQLKADMEGHGIKLPPVWEDKVADAVIEGAYQILKAKGGSFFAGLKSLQLD